MRYRFLTVGPRRMKKVRRRAELPGPALLSSRSSRRSRLRRLRPGCAPASRQHPRRPAPVRPRSLDGYCCVRELDTQFRERAHHPLDGVALDEGGLSGSHRKLEAHDERLVRDIGHALHLQRLEDFRLDLRTSIISTMLLVALRSSRRRVVRSAGRISRSSSRG